MNNVVIGAGEIGLALLSIIREHHSCGIVDIGFNETEYSKGEIDIMHITIPYVYKFVQTIDDYIKNYEPRIVMIESTVAVGACRQIQVKSPDVKVYHSPVRGRHKNIRKHLLSFVKYWSGEKPSLKIKEYLEGMGIENIFFHKWETTELGKLLSTAQYGRDLVFADEMKRICDEFKVDYSEAVEHFNATYNQGYKDTQFQRSILVPPNGKIGGHCVVQNAKLLREQIESLDLDSIIKYE